MPGIEHKIRQIPPDLQREVEDFVDLLLSRISSGGQRYVKQDWAGGLEQFREQYTALELQHKDVEWRTGIDIGRLASEPQH